MSEKLRTIRLYGSLGRKFGRVHRLAVSSVHEAIRALRVVCPGFEQELMTSKDRGIGYGIWVGKENLKDTKQFRYPVGNDDIRIAPILMGAKRGGLMQIFIGIVIVVAAVWTGGAAAGAAGAAGGAAGAGAGSFLGVTGGYAVAAQMGAALALGGLVQFLSPVSSVSGTGSSSDNGSSYNFRGAVNTQAQGGPVPLLYGEMTVGSAVISAGIYAEDQA
jgi:predicted phage tail protein|nr:MAG TPA: tail assembly protein [Caudoviricetes sp.]